jgi:hypothetical protein
MLMRAAFSCNTRVASTPARLMALGLSVTCGAPIEEELALAAQIGTQSAVR